MRHGENIYLHSVVHHSGYDPARRILLEYTLFGGMAIQNLSVSGDAMDHEGTRVNVETSD